ncbi:MULTISPECIES: phosphatase PAP2 family protein [unclassified Streptomyces]|uniref:phosphatase PAP2 family protein n=1 Tax=unclassified Streptomyces TaxID=2593676 RepID=UPI002E2A45A5|nr:phosphatase PAP2 family protein [Streptomyces sp. NBC_01429]
MDSSATSDLYLDITDFARTTPSWFQHLAELWTEAGLLLFGVLFVAVWWFARPSGTRAVAVAVLAPLATAVAYVCSEVLKTFFTEDRPCRAVVGAGASLVACPPVGDWSFPSNHSTIAGGAAIALALARPVLAYLTVPMAILMAFSRVFVGVHYPHDVAVGLVLGGLMATLVVLLAARPVQTLVGTMRTSKSGLALWLAGTGERVGVERGRHSAGRR